ncbi:hypothetical protein TrVE_jg5883 [Triparma verrucosa]|uniref:Uncharacterized protein n=1 Tax=Triparma verrucosa TaxID=1606542 RepID=A0A9W7KTD1_9STRA|nr:hypothetical protein TrVE_jg5883 [Triparma verrucosa]
MQLSLVSLLGCALTAAATPENPLLDLLEDHLSQKHLGSHTIPNSQGLYDSPSDLKAYYNKCEGFTTKLVCDFLRNEAQNKGLTALEHYNNVIGDDNHYEGELGFGAEPSGIQYPYCSWRYMYSQLNRSNSAWNVAFPDQNSIYHASLVYFNEDDEFVIKGPNIPYVRYFSLQTYDPTAASLDSVIDYQMRTEFNSGSNAYNNATCGEAGDAQGSFDIRITAHGMKYSDNGFINELAALPLDRSHGFFFLFLRLYDPQPYPEDNDSWSKKMSPMIDECYGVEGVENMEEAKRWGWVCPPTLKRTNTHSGLMTELPYCVAGRDNNFKNYNQGAAPGRLCLLRPNSKDNLFLPANDNMHGMFRNHDANYLIGCALHNREEDEDKEKPHLRGRTSRTGDLWARVAGELPLTANSLYDSPYVGDPTNFDIRYISISSINRSPPSAVMKSVKDDEIIAHLKAREGELSRNRNYVLWFGPDEESLPPVARKEGGMYMPWPREQLEDENGTVTFGDLVPYPGILYREILSQGQTLSDDEVDYSQGITDIIRDRCYGSEPFYDKVASETRQTRNLRPYCYEEMCCGDSPPECCRERRHIHSTMRQHYPKIDYYFVDGEGRLTEAEDLGAGTAK